MDIKRKLQQTPTSPGIYIMKGSKERVIYVGKAKNLRNRLRSYFQNSASLDERKSKMVEEIRDFDYVVTENELEALILEANFIKRSKPKYNIILRDDKNYPYLKLTVNEEWPRIEVVRKIEKDGALYFGPYVPAGAMWEMLNFIRRHFPIRICRHNLSKPFRPCVQHQMGRCLAPCAESLRTETDREKYRGIVKEVKAFIQGEKKELLTSLRERMALYSEKLLYEEAAKIRDRINALEKAWESQRVIAPELGDIDVIGLYREKGEADLFVLFIRRGMVIGQKDFFFKKLDDMGNDELVSGFIEQFYSKALLLPPKISIPVASKLETQREWLTKRRGGPVRFTAGRGEIEKKVRTMAAENAFYAFHKHKDTRVDETLMTIKDLLHLKSVPHRIGAFDISNLSGSEAVGAFVFFEEGKFVKDEYRMFRIRSVQGIDDFAMMGEAVDRYMKGLSGQRSAMPDLILIDGGKGQLRSAVNAMRQYDVSVELAGIAKARDELPGRNHGVRSDLERIYVSGRRDPLYLDPSSPSTHLLQKVRDEVHRFAVSYHKKLRAKRTLTSPLEQISGIGKTRRLILLKHFGSIDGIRAASSDEIAALKGMNKKVAEELKKSLQK